MLILFTVTFAKRRIQCNIAHRTHISGSVEQTFGSVSGSLGRLVATSKCMGSYFKSITIIIVWYSVAVDSYSSLINSQIKSKIDQT